MNEFERIATYFRPLTKQQPGALDLSDDAALLSIKEGRQLVVSTDAMVEGVHFLPGTSADRLAGKLLAVNLSDLAAMGARPLAYVLALALPIGSNAGWLEDFSSGLAQMQERWAIDLVGGDSVSTAGPISATITIMGTVVSGKALRRSGARAGDDVYVTGSIGDGVLGLRAARGELARLPDDVIDQLASRYHLPTPRVDVAQMLVGLASAAIDVSDGLVADLGHISGASGVGIRVLADTVPLSDAARQAVNLMTELRNVALTGGDDYELAFAAPPEAADELIAISSQSGIAITKVGEVVPGSGVVMIDGSGSPIELPKGWRHF